MRRFSKKHFFTVCVIVLLTFSICMTANAEMVNDQPEVAPASLILSPIWIRDEVSVPGLNGSARSNEWTYKANDELTASFYCLGKSIDRNFDARMINSSLQARSAWARDLDINSLIYASEYDVVEVGYKYTFEVSSDLLTLGAVDVDLAFSPDRMTNTNGIY